MEPQPVKWYRSKTVWAGVVAIVAGAGAFMQGLGTESLLTAVAGGVMILMRILTKAPLE